MYDGSPYLQTARTSLSGIAEARPILDAGTSPLEVQVTGRRGVGKSVVAALLETSSEQEFAVVETGGVDMPLAPEPTFDGDVVVYVVNGVPTGADAIAVGRAENVITVLTKLDTFDDPPAVLARAVDVMGRPVLPLMATIALGSAVDYADLRSIAAETRDPSILLGADIFFEADLTVSIDRRRALISAVELWGVRLIVQTLRRTPTVTDAELGGMLRRASGFDDFWAAMRAALLAAGANRDLRTHENLRTLAARSASARDAVELYLSCDDAVLAEMAASMVALGAPASTGSPVRDAATWRDRAERERDPRVQRAAIAVARGYLRLAAR